MESQASFCDGGLSRILPARNADILVPPTPRHYRQEGLNGVVAFTVIG